MSSNNTNSDTPNIDAAKQITPPGASYFEKVQTFLYTLMKKILHVLIYIIIAGMVLYSCKVAQSSIIPTETGCMPYEGNAPTIKPVKTNVFETVFSDPPMSEKLTIPYEKSNTKNIILDTLRGFKEKPNISAITMYFISIFESVIAFNYSALEMFFNLLNNLPECIILILGPFVTLIYLVVIFIVDHIYFFITWFSQMKWFFKTNLNDTQKGSPEWHDITFEDLFAMWVSIGLVIVFIILAFFMVPLLMTVGSLVILTFCMFSIIGYTGYLNGKPIGIIGIEKNIFKNYKIYISIILSFIVIATAFSILGPVPGTFAFLTVLLIYFGFITMSIYRPVPEVGLTVAVPIEQAKKTFDPASKDGSSSGEHGLYSLFYGQGGGGSASLIKKLKKLNNM